MSNIYSDFFFKLIHWIHCFPGAALFFPHCIVVIAKNWASYCLCPKCNQAKFKEPIFHLSHNYCLTMLNRQALHVIFAWHTTERIGKSISDVWWNSYHCFQLVHYYFFDRISLNTQLAMPICAQKSFAYFQGEWFLLMLCRWLHFLLRERRILILLWNNL